MTQYRLFSWLFGGIILACALGWSIDIAAHERWILTEDEIVVLDAKPKPEIFTTITAANTIIVAIALLLIAGWVRLDFTGARELFPDLQARLYSYGDYASVVIRFCTAWALISSAFALEPRAGNAMLASPTLFAPDLELRFLSEQWQWLREVEIVCGIVLLLGIWVRLIAVVLVVMALIGWALFGQAMFVYLPALAGVAIYLFFQGPGTHYIAVPVPARVEPWLHTLSSIPRPRVQFMLRVLTGFNILYLAIYFKVLHPTLILGIIEQYHLPIFDFSPDTSTFIIAIMEISLGLFMILGILMRPMALIMLGAFLFFASFLEETYTAHIIFYGVMITFFFNSAGYWRWSTAKDKVAHIVILGGGFAAVRAAMKLEKLKGQFSNIQVTLIHPYADYLFHPLLPEVVGGSIQPNNIVNPLRCIIPSTTTIRGSLTGIDTEVREITVQERSEEARTIAYDELIVAMSPMPDFGGIPGLAAQGQAINSVGDALHLRQLVLQCVEQAERLPMGEARQRLLTFVVIGGNERGTGTALEIRALLNAASSAYRGIPRDESRVLLFEGDSPEGAGIPVLMRRHRDRILRRNGVELMQQNLPDAVTAEGVSLSGGRRESSAVVVNARFRYPDLYLSSGDQTELLRANKMLNSPTVEHVWIASPGNLLNPGGLVTTGVLRAQGVGAAYNAWASSQGFPLRQPLAYRGLIQVFHMGRNSTAKLFGIGFSGIPAWLLARFSCLATLPGLERNLRMLIDWLLDIPFRNDIAVLTPERSEKFSQVHYEAGDTIMRQGEIGDAAYIIKSGRVKVLKDDELLATLGEGDCFGEIALLSNTPRTATVVCETPVELTMLVRDQFVELAEGFHALGEALNRQSARRLKGL